MQSQEKVLRVASLARLDLGAGLSDEEASAKLALFARQFDDIVGLMDTLAQVDTTGVEPLYWPVSGPTESLREDEAIRHNTREELLRNAPEQDGQFFIVPKIV